LQASRIRTSAQFAASYAAAQGMCPSNVPAYPREPWLLFEAAVTRIIFIIEHGALGRRMENL